MRQEKRDRVEEHLHLSGQQIGERRRGAAEWDVHDVGAGRKLQHFAKQVRLCPKSG